MTVPTTPLFTDLYQLTMMQGYMLTGLNKRMACFDLFFRNNPFGGGYTVAAGLEDALKFLQNLHFSEDDLEYLVSLKFFKKDFIDYLKDFRFQGEVYAVPEGTLVFPMEPILRVHAPLDQCQLVETGLLNIINFQTLIATKAARVCQEAGSAAVLEFGLRRAQGPDGALTASRSAYIGGCTATSNVEAGKVYGIPIGGTHAHSWVMAFESELESFRAFAEIYPDNTVLLVDTYNTLRSGVPNAVKVGLEMKEKGKKLLGIRLDSGDLAFLSAEARKMLDGAGLTGVKIFTSNELDEHIIHDMKIQGAAIDAYGVGTRMITASGEPALSGVYKMSAMKDGDGEWLMKIKLTEGMKKGTLPGVKQVWRLRDKKGEMMADIMELESARPDFEKGVWGYHPAVEYEKKFFGNIEKADPLLKPVFKDGKIETEFPPLADIRDRVKKQLNGLHPTMRRLLNPHIYKVSLGEKLFEETRRMRRGV